MIREFIDEDIPNAARVHVANGLPPECFPELTIENAEGATVSNPLFMHKAVFEVEGRAAMSCFLKVTSELYLLIDHEVGTPEERWAWLQEFKEYMKQVAWLRGLDQMSAWIPLEIEEAFGKRLLDLGFIKSRFACYTLNIA